MLQISSEAARLGQRRLCMLHLVVLGWLSVSNQGRNVSPCPRFS
jgi:hypothetical protein